MRQGGKPGKSKAETRRSVGRKSAKNDALGRRDLEKRLAEALEQIQARNHELAEAQDQQTATSEILRVISASPTDVEPVFHAIVTSGRRLCNASQCLLVGFDGEMLSLLATDNLTAEGGEAVRRVFPYRASRVGTTGRVVLDRRVVHIADVTEDPEYGFKDVARTAHTRAHLGVPMFRGNEVIGVLLVTRAEPGPFTPAQVDLLQTFADQAVIAIENVRLFNETKEALEQQTATSEILRVISSSPTDLQPVLDTVVQSAVRFCGAYDAILFLLDGGAQKLAAHHGPLHVPHGLLVPVVRGTIGGRAVLDRRAVHVADLQAETEEFPEGSAFARDLGHRTILAVPLLREGEPVGTIQLRRTEVSPFTEKQIALLETFADQAVIAVENVRLFKELEGRNRDLTATSEVLRVISSSQTDVQPVFDTIVRSAVRLCNGLFGTVWQFDGELIHQVAQHNYTAEALEEARRAYPTRPSRSHGSARAILERALVHIPDVELDPEFQFQFQALSRAVGWRSGLFVPMLREGSPIGAIAVTRAEPGPFSDSEIELLKTFADQAVIAIENVRLFNELEARNAEQTDTLARQMATGEVLRAISRAQTDTQPVFDIIATSARRLCGASYGQVQLYDGELIRLAALDNVDPEGAEAIRRAYPLGVGEGNLGGRVIERRAVVQIPDLLEDGAYQYKSTWEASGLRSLLGVPMLRDGEPIGAIAVGRLETGLFPDKEVELLQTFADQAVIAIENVRLFTELQASNRELATALDTQTATSDILRVISRSPTDVQPVFDAIVASAVRLLGAYAGGLTRIAGDQIELAALTSTDAAGDAAVRATFPQSLEGESLPAQVIRDRAPVNIANVQTDPRVSEVARVFALARGYRSLVMVPLLHHDEAVGTIAVSRRETGGFTDDEIALLKTFADQAVIAIENVRLFTELQERNRAVTQAHAQVSEALEQQTATAEILRVISRSPTDVQPVFDAVAESAARLCEAQDAGIFRRDGERLLFVAHHGSIPFGPVGEFSIPLVRGTANGRSVLDAQTIHVADLQTEVHEYPEGSEGARRFGHRTFLIVPLMREGVAIGSISVRRIEAQLFTDRQVTLLQTFADQAVIAIENVRLFTELQASNRELTTALDTQTATSDILRVISQSQTNVQPVFDTIVRSAVRLCNGLFSGLFQFDGELLHFVAQHNHTPEALEEVRRVYPARPTRALGTGRAILERTVIHLPDVEVDPEYQHHAISRAIGFRSGLFVPMVREGAPIGVIVVARAEAGAFSDSEIELLKTFADQAVIAVENVRLFKELEARTGELTQSVEQLTALGEVSRAVSSTLDVETVLDTIVSRASQLAGAAGCSIYEYDEGAERFELRATHNDDTAFVEALQSVPLRKGEGLMGRAAEMREPIQIPDITQPGAYQSSVRDTLIRFGYRALLAVPLLREDQTIGSLSFNRKAPGEFPPEVVDVLKTFATQSALAIQNARLFREIADKSAQLEAASRHKSEFLANMSHELRTPLNAIIGFSEILAEKMFGDVNEKQTEYLRDILESGRHLLSLINDILDLSKIEAGRMELELSEFDLPQAIENALILVRERASRRGIRLGSTIDPQLGVIRGDERKVKQVLLNLLSNALKFTPEGGRIDVRARPADDMVEVSVADTGIGIASADQDAVFEEFRQVGTADKKAEGTGLGLALSRKFIELHGGRIWVKSQLGAGSTFAFTLPLGR